jgi:ABC-2 type transport system permease protein
MNKRRIWAIARKEWLDMGKNKLVLAMMALLPVIMVGMILGTTWFLERTPEQDFTGSDSIALPPELAHLDSKTGTLILLNDQYMFYLLLIALALPVYVASYSIIGEKETRSLEPLLATPITTAELLIGKVIVAAVPSVVLTWVSFVLTAAGMYFITSTEVVAALVRPVWTLSIVLHSPLLALLSTSCGVIASSRLNDPRAAQQVTALFIVPLIGLSMAVLIGKIYLSTTMMMVATVVLVLINIGVLWLAVRLFQRELILTRWK